MQDTFLINLLGAGINNINKSCEVGGSEAIILQIGLKQEFELGSETLVGGRPTILNSFDISRGIKVLMMCMDFLAILGKVRRDLLLSFFVTLLIKIAEAGNIFTRKILDRISHDKVRFGASDGHKKQA